MLVVLVVEVLRPLLKLSPASNMVGLELRQLRANLRDDRVVRLAENLRRFKNRRVEIELLNIGLKATQDNVEK